MSLIAYHGTAEQYVPSILREGLKPWGAPGADEWAAKQGNHAFLRNRREARIYVSTEEKVAEQFAAYAADLTRTKPIVLQCKIERPELWREDTHAEGMNAMWSREPLPPEAIAIFREVEPDTAERMVRRFNSDDRLLLGILNMLMEGNHVR